MLHPRTIDAFLTRQLRFWDPLGERQEFALVNFGRAMVHRKFLVFCGLFLLLFFATDPSGNRAYVPLWVSASIWPISYVMYMSLYAVLLGLQSLATAFWTSLRVPTSLICFVVLIPAVYVIEFVYLDAMSGGTYPQNMRGNLLFYFLAAQVSEAVFYKFIFPGMRESIGLTPAEADTESEDRHVIIGGERVRLSDIHYIEAREHHVHITFATSETRVRARLRDVVAQTSEDDGIQTHRSWWVARHAVKGLQEKPKKSTLELTDGRSVPVARTRIRDVREWTDTNVRTPDFRRTAAE